MNEDRRATVRTMALAATLFVTFRGALLLLDFIGLRLIPAFYLCMPQWSPLGFEHEFWNGFFRWDAAWYRNIALAGYRYDPLAPSSVAFYPAFPYLARWIGVVLGGPFVAGLLISNSGTLAGLYYLLRLGDDFFDASVAERAAIQMLIFPTTFFLMAFYSEGLFFGLSAAAMYYYYRGRYVACGLLGGLAMLTRSSGLALFIAFAVDLSFELRARRARFRPGMCGLLLIPLGLVAFMSILWVTVGEPLAFVTVMKHWHREGSWPWASLVRDLPLFVKLPSQDWEARKLLDLLAAYAFLFIGAAMIWTRKKASEERYPIGMSIYVLVGVLIPLCTLNTDGMTRYVVVLFPALYYLASKCRKYPRMEQILVVCFVFLLAIYSIRFMRCGFVA